MHIKLSWGATNGLILVVSKNGGANVSINTTAAAAKAAAPHAMTHFAIGRSVQLGVAASVTAAYTIKGVRIWDRALTQAELEALTPADCVQGGKYGTVEAPPWGYAPSGAQENDNVYGYLVSGEGYVVPETFDFEDSESSIFRYLTFNIATERWLAQRSYSTAINEASVVGGIRASLRRGMI
jgi:hypothetical protein